MHVKMLDERATGGAPPLIGLAGLFLFAALLLAPAVVALFVPTETIEERLRALAYSVVLWTTWVALWGKAYRACLAATPFLAVVPVAVYLLIAYHSQLNPA